MKLSSLNQSWPALRMFLAGTHIPSASAYLPTVSNHPHIQDPLQVLRFLPFLLLLLLLFVIPNIGLDDRHLRTCLYLPHPRNLVRAASRISILVLFLWPGLSNEGWLQSRKKTSTFTSNTTALHHRYCVVKKQKILFLKFMCRPNRLLRRRGSTRSSSFRLGRRALFLRSWSREVGLNVNMTPESF